MALLYQAQGKYKEAEEYYLKALKILEKELGENHPNTKIVKNNLEYLQETIRNNP